MREERFSKREMIMRAVDRLDRVALFALAALLLAFMGTERYWKRCRSAFSGRGAGTDSG